MSTDTHNSEDSGEEMPSKDEFSDHESPRSEVEADVDWVEFDDSEGMFTEGDESTTETSQGRTEETQRTDDEGAGLSPEFSIAGTGSALDTVHSVSPYAAWVLASVLYYTKETIWFVLPSLVVSVVIAGVALGPSEAMASVQGLLSIDDLVLAWMVANPWTVFGGWVATFIVFALRMGRWTFDSTEFEGVLPLVIGGCVASVVSASGVVFVWSGVVEWGMVTVGGVYLASMWLTGNWLWKLLVHDENQNRLPVLQPVWILGTRVPLVFGVVTFVFGVYSGLSSVVSVGIIVSAPVFVVVYLVWRSIALRDGGSVDVTEAGDDSEYLFDP